MTGMELLEAKTGKMEENKQRFTQKKLRRDETRGKAAVWRLNGLVFLRKTSDSQNYDDKSSDLMS